MTSNMILRSHFVHESREGDHPAPGAQGNEPPRFPRLRSRARRVSTTLRHSDTEFSEYPCLSFVVC
jgi:hypothetical protein